MKSARRPPPGKTRRDEATSKPATTESTDDPALRAYYAARAPVYDRVYEKAERQADLRHLEHWAPTLLEGRTTLEIACGTGYWTQFIAPVVKKLVATDVSLETLRLARARDGVGSVEFRLADAYQLSEALGTFDAAFCALWVSHVPKQRLRAFLEGLHRRLLPGSPVLLIDNASTQCRELPITATDAHGNTYQTRVTDDQTEYRVLKNFPARDALIAATSGLGIHPHYQELEHFWACHYLTAGQDEAVDAATRPSLGLLKA